MLAGSSRECQSNSPTWGGLLHIRKGVIQLVDQTLAPAPDIAGDTRNSGAACRHDAAAQWRALAASIAGAGRMRVSKDGGRTYPRRYERSITSEPPNQPAAVLIYDRSGAARTFSVDLDASKGGPQAVERDYRSLCAILTRVGAAFFADRSPNGGVHVYVPLEVPLTFHDARDAALALAAQTPTMDPMPMLGIDSGCIRPTGARHKSGGHQELIGSLTAAYVATQSPTSTDAWARFTAELGPAPVAPSEPSEPSNVTQLRPVGRHNAPDATYQAIARTGEYDATRHASPSEARQAVIWACVAAGMQMRDVAARLADGRWPGLAAMYARYRPHSRHQALVRDWNSAVQFEKQRRETTSKGSVRVGTTRAPKTHGGASVYEDVRSWANAVDLIFDQNRRDDLAARAVLNALAEAAQKTAALTVEFGNRSLAIATGLDQATVGKCLNRLVEDDDALIDLVQPASGVKANVYQLVIPESVRDAAERRTWKKGKISGVRAAFRELGLPAAFMYAALEQRTGPVSGRDLAIEARLGVTSAYDALATLHAFGLAVRTRDGWALGPGNLDRLAEAFGILDQIKAQIERYREERRAYWAMLGIIRLVDAAGGAVGTYDHDPPPAPPPDDVVTLMDMLEDLLGAHLVDEIHHRAG